jgi:hypothetical protein
MNKYKHTKKKKKTSQIWENNFTICQNMMSKHKHKNCHGKFDKIISQIVKTIWINTNMKIVMIESKACAKLSWKRKIMNKKYCKQNFVMTLSKIKI